MPLVLTLTRQRGLKTTYTLQCSMHCEYAAAFETFNQGEVTLNWTESAFLSV
jgi:hypothetical protein